MLETVKSRCPCCGEPIHLVIDLSLEEQQYIEDCEVCCRPMVVSVAVSPEGYAVSVESEDQT
ncbi:MAG: CPXCG motif-containing cysteine-rich protein [Pseudomonadota bacterium]